MIRIRQTISGLRGSGISFPLTRFSAESQIFGNSWSSLTRIISGSTVQVRGKRNKAGTDSAAKTRLINLMSLVTHRKKQPKRLKLSYEDQIRHSTIHKAWMLLCREKREKRHQELETMYRKMVQACDELERTSPELYNSAMKRQASLRFPLEYRIPTQSPPTKIWNSEWKKPSSE
ncbi:mitochondrial ribosomal protein L28-domain-containing protein [Dipodascopsis uninucleata]